MIKKTATGILIGALAVLMLLPAGCQVKPSDNASKPARVTAYPLRSANLPVLNTAKYRDLATKLQPGMSTWVTGEALKICDLNASENMLIEDIQNHFRGQRLTQDAINTLQALVLMQAIDNLDKEISTLTEKRDEAGRLTDELELKLQTAMDRYSKCIETLSNIMNKTSETGDTIIQNLK